jgi:hypothetical protein
VAVFGGTGSVSATALNSAGAAISASSGQWRYRPYYNGVPAAASSYASAGSVTGTGAPWEHTGTVLGPVTGPDLTSLKTDPCSVPSSGRT